MDLKSLLALDVTTQREQAVFWPEVTRRAE
jgi:hypothetical protein